MTHVSLWRVLAVSFCLIAASAPVSAGERQDARLLTAAQVLDELQQTPDQNVPNWLLDRAYGLAVIPGVIKVGLGIGGRRGKGVLVVRQEDGTWSNPVFVNLTGGSFGFQVGVQSTDVVLVFMSQASIEGIAGGKITLGADAAVAAGPIGRQTAAATDIGLNAQVYSYSRSSGIFAGVALDGSAITIDDSSNEAFYGRPRVLASEIIALSAPPAPPPADQFLAAVTRATGAPGAPGTLVVPPRPPAPGETPPATGQMPREPAAGDAGSVTTYPMEDPAPGSEPPE
ncbi:MAG TPA: lipid-binding SYLF domain-containing protein [Steroidobacteraceae bacterium]|nr:lipid-binding SYLF domain-containing protein [Steroidobacteraceae bacterium]